MYVIMVNNSSFRNIAGLYQDNNKLTAVRISATSRILTCVFFPAQELKWRMLFALKSFAFGQLRNMPCANEKCKIYILVYLLSWKYLTN